jgi:hypothetical protein
MKIKGFCWLGLLLLVGCGGAGNEIEDRHVHESLTDDDVVTDDGRYLDHYWFKALEDGTAISNIDSSAFNPVIEIYDERGHLVSEDDDSGAGDDARTSFRVSFGKFYEIVVTSKNPGETGAYDLTVSSQLIYDSVIDRGHPSKGR